MKNQTDTIKNKSQIILTAKAYKFVWKCIDIIVASKGLSRYSPEAKDLKIRFQTIAEHLFIDKELSISQVKELIKKSNLHSID